MKDQGQPKQGTGSANERLNQQNSERGNEQQQGARSGGHAGYSSDEEQKQVNRENEHMHNERDEKDLDTSQEQKIDVDEDDRNVGNQNRQGKTPGL